MRHPDLNQLVALARRDRPAPGALAAVARSLRVPFVAVPIAAIVAPNTAIASVAAKMGLSRLALLGWGAGSTVVVSGVALAVALSQPAALPPAPPAPALPPAPLVPPLLPLAPPLLPPLPVLPPSPPLVPPLLLPPLAFPPELPPLAGGVLPPLPPLARVLLVPPVLSPPAASEPAVEQPPAATTARTSENPKRRVYKDMAQLSESPPPHVTQETTNAYSRFTHAKR